MIQPSKWNVNKNEEETGKRSGRLRLMIQRLVAGAGILVFVGICAYAFLFVMLNFV